MSDPKRRLLAINEQALILVVRNRAASLGFVDVERRVYAAGADGRNVDTGATKPCQVERFSLDWLEQCDRVELRQEVEAATIGATSRIDALLAADIENPLRQLVYLEDNRKHRKTPVLFETDCPWDVEQLAKLSASVPGAGRASTQFGAFQWLLLHEGFRCKQVERLAERAKVPAGYEVVMGAAGSY
jgi:hypothetical protein